MKKLILLVLLMLLIPSVLFAAEKVTDLDAITSMTDDDLIMVVDAPATTPVSKKMTGANLKTSVFGNPTFTGVVTFPIAADPTTDADGEASFDTDGWGSGYDALEIWNGTASAYVVATTASDAPTNGQVPVWNTGGAITWEDMVGSSGDVAAVGDCTTGDCLDGSSDGGTYVRLYDGTSAYVSVTGGVRAATVASSTADSESLIVTLGNNDNTVTLSSGTGATTLNANAFTLSANGILPDAADGAALGSAAAEWSDVYLADGGVIYGQNDQSNTITSGATGWTFNLAVTAPSFQSTKTSGVAGDDGLYEADSTGTGSAGWRGPDSLAANKSYRGKFPTDRATSANMVLAWTNAGEAGDGADATPWVQAMSFVDLDTYALLAAPVFTTSIESPLLILGSAATAADAGIIRLPNAEYIYAEADAAGTDISVIGVDSSEVVQIAASGASGVTITPDTTITGDLTVTGSDLTLGAAGVKLTGDGDGAITFLGLGDGSDEDLIINLDDTANTAVISSSTGVDTVSISAMNLVTTGAIQGGIKISSDADGMDAAAMTAAGMYGTMFIATGAGTWILPSGAVGMSGCLMDSGTAHDLIVDVTAGDTMRLKGTEQADGVGITNAAGSTTGDFVCFVCVAANKWSSVGMGGTWASQ